MKLWLIRHTSVGVEPGICYGQSDVALANTFNKEKIAVAAQIENQYFDKVYSSPLSRCSLLAEFLFPQTQINYDSRLKELNFGDWEMQSWDEIYKLPEGKRWMDDYLNQPCLGGEYYNDLLNRVGAFLNEIISHDFEQVAVVTHAGVIRALKSIIEEVSLDELFSDFKIEYGHVSYLTIKNTNQL